jgi:hypothetical protein
MKNLLLVLPLLLSLAACNPSAPSTEGGATKAPQPQINPIPPTDADPATPPANARQAAPSSNADLLQGKWRSDDDPSNVLEFAAGKRIEGGDAEPYTLGDHCTNPSVNNSFMAGGKYRYISCVQSDQCWYINELTTDKLSLSYMGRGNTLNYTRMK